MVSRFGFVLRRVAESVPLLVGITLGVFLLLEITPGDPARALLGPRAPEAAVQAERERLGLDGPITTRFISYVGRAAQGDLGASIRSQQPVTELVADRAPVTLWLLGAGLAFSLAASVPLAVLAARNRDRAADHVIRGFSFFGLTMPPFWVGLMLILFVALPTEIFPVGGFGETPAEHLRAVVLPGLTMALFLSPVQIRSLRAGILTVLASEHVAAARSLGTPEGRLYRRHVLRNAAGPAVALLAVQAAAMLFGAVVIEATFGLPGLGQAMVLAVQQRDFPVVQGLTLVFAVAVLVVNLLADVAQVLLDPRVELR
jgi:peptide/nickel transport system permease protein